MGPTPALLTLSLPQEVHLSMKGYRPAREVLSSPGEILVRLQAEPRKASVGKVARPAPAEKEKEKPPAQPAANHFKEGLD